MLILKLYFTSKSSGTACEAFSNACPDKEIPNKTKINRMVTHFWDTGVYNM
jgi:hypothetical protein